MEDEYSSDGVVYAKGDDEGTLNCDKNGSDFGTEESLSCVQRKDNAVELDQDISTCTNLNTMDNVKDQHAEQQIRGEDIELNTRSECEKMEVCGDIAADTADDVKGNTKQIIHCDKAVSPDDKVNCENGGIIQGDCKNMENNLDVVQNDTLDLASINKVRENTENIVSDAHDHQTDGLNRDMKCREQMGCESGTKMNTHQNGEETVTAESDGTEGSENVNISTGAEEEMSEIQNSLESKQDLKDIAVKSKNSKYDDQSQAVPITSESQHEMEVSEDRNEPDIGQQSDGAGQTDKPSADVRIRAGENTRIEIDDKNSNNARVVDDTTNKSLDRECMKVDESVQMDQSELENAGLPSESTSHSDKHSEEESTKVNESVQVDYKENENAGVPYKTAGQKDKASVEESMNNGEVAQMDSIESNNARAMDNSTDKPLEEKSMNDGEVTQMDYREHDNVGAVDDSADDESEDSDDSSDDNTNQDTEKTINKAIGSTRDSSPERKVRLNRHGFEDMRTKGEIMPEELPPLEELTITVDETVEMVEVGTVASVVGLLVIVKSGEDVPPLNDDTILFVEGHKVLGQVFEVFGPVKTPWYSVRFNDSANIEAKGIEPGTRVFCAPKEESFTKFVFVDSIKKMKGSDASWEDNNEPPAKHLDYSDDEEEKRAKAKRKSDRKAQSQTGTDKQTGGVQATDGGGQQKKSKWQSWPPRDDPGPRYNNDMRRGQSQFDCPNRPWVRPNQGQQQHRSFNPTRMNNPRPDNQPRMPGQGGQSRWPLSDDQFTWMCPNRPRYRGAPPRFGGPPNFNNQQGFMNQNRQPFIRGGNQQQPAVVFGGNQHNINTPPTQFAQPRSDIGQVDFSRPPPSFQTPARFQSPQDPTRFQGPQDQTRFQASNDPPRFQNPMDPPRFQGPQDPQRFQAPQDPPRFQAPQDPPRFQNPMDPPRFQGPQDPPRFQAPQEPGRFNSPMDQPRFHGPMDPPRFQGPMDPLRFQAPQENIRFPGPQQPSNTMQGVQDGRMNNSNNTTQFGNIPAPQGQIRGQGIPFSVQSASVNNVQPGGPNIQNNGQGHQTLLSANNNLGPNIQNNSQNQHYNPATNQQNRFMNEMQGNMNATQQGNFRHNDFQKQFEMNNQSRQQGLQVTSGGDQQRSNIGPGHQPNNIVQHQPMMPHNQHNSAKPVLSALPGNRPTVPPNQSDNMYQGHNMVNQLNIMDKEQFSVAGNQSQANRPGSMVGESGMSYGNQFENRANQQHGTNNNDQFRDQTQSYQNPYNGQQSQGVNMNNEMNMTGNRGDGPRNFDGQNNFDSRFKNGPPYNNPRLVEDTRFMQGR